MRTTAVNAFLTYEVTQIYLRFVETGMIKHVNRNLRDAAGT